MNLGKFFASIVQLYLQVIADEALLDGGGSIPINLTIGSRNGKPVILTGGIKEG
jgi:hypothetical protein